MTLLWAAALAALLLNSSGCSGVSTVAANQRFDLDRKSGVYHPVSSSALTASPQLERHQRAASAQKEVFSTSSNAGPGRTITYQLDCVSGDSRCDNVDKALDSATRRLESIFSLRAPILVQAKFHSFCTDNNSCGNSASTNGTVGWAYPASQWTLGCLEGVDSKYLYPQSLAKQLSPKDLEWNKADIVAEFNSDLASDVYWFKSDTPIKRGQVDIEYMFVHELMHGLGYTSSLGAQLLLPQNRPLLVPPMSPTDLRLVMPNLQLVQNVNTQVVSISGVSTPFIFDRFLAIDPTLIPGLSSASFVSKQSNPLKADMLYPLDQLYDIFYGTNAGSGNQTLCLTDSPPSWARTLLASNDISTLSKLLFTAGTTPRAMRLLVPSNLTSNTSMSSLQIGVMDRSTSSLILSTQPLPDGSFADGSSIVHVDSDTYRGTAEFLMMPSAPLGNSMEMLVQQGNNNKADALPIGPLTLRLFAGMGYTLKPAEASPRKSTVQSGATCTVSNGGCPNAGSNSAPRRPNNASHSTALSLLPTSPFLLLSSSVVFSLLHCLI
ncbi:hypothetical protein GQ42DRAFT_165056 [Ramicandelaber brevisporus]|nr:hypothetical protein GQ42DRAFT_165056 [Ramicandelaber brevisporus]